NAKRIAASLAKAYDRTSRKDALPSAHVLRAAHASLSIKPALALHHLRTAERLFADAAMSERQASVAWQRAKLDNDPVETAAQEARLKQLGIVDIAGWAKYRTPGCAPTE